jgi:hypothetical protein
MSDQEIRAKILQDLYYKRRNGLEILMRTEDYAKLLGISDDLASFNIQYLAMAGLVDAGGVGSLGTTKKWWWIKDITSYGIEAVEGTRRQGLAVNFNTININAPITQSNIAAGEKITQTQSLNTFQDIERYVKQNLSGPIADAIRSELQELQGEIQKDQVKPSRTQKIKDLCMQYGPAALAVSDAVLRLVTAYLQSGHPP